MPVIFPRCVKEKIMNGLLSHTVLHNIVPVSLYRDQVAMSFTPRLDNSY